MTLILHSDPLPLRVDETGTIRVGATRVTLDVVLADYLGGMTAEEIVRQMDSLELADVHAAIAYYHRHRQEVDDYLQRRRAEANALRRTIEGNDPTRVDLKEKLLSRMAQRTAAMLRLLSDEDVPGDIVFGLRKRQPELDIARVQEVGLMHAIDADILEWATRESRQVITRDRNTMTASAYERVINGMPMLGIFVIPEQMLVGQAVLELEIIALASESKDWRDRVIFLPL